MHIESIQIKNLRAIKNAHIFFDKYTSLVGANGAGKSTVLCALNIFFRENDNSTTDLLTLTEEDFHKRDTTEPIEITVTFVDLDKDAQAEFKEYFRQGKLVVSAIAKYDPNTKQAEVRQFGQRLGIEDFKEFFKALGDKALVKDLQGVYEKLQSKYKDLPSEKVKDSMVEALHKYEADHKDKCVLIPSEDQFYGVSKGTNRLQRFIQWVYVPAVKNALEEQAEEKNTALGKLLARTVRSKINFDTSVKELIAETEKKYGELLDKNQGALDAISGHLHDRMIQWAHPDVSLKISWQQEPNKSVRIEQPFAKITAGEGGFEGNLARFGHGFQRSYLLALLQELANIDDKAAPTLILGCEEPELYQHPPQARHLFGVFTELSQGNAQIVCSTHSPYFVSGEYFENVRLVRRDPANQQSRVKHLIVDEFAKKYAAYTGKKLVQKNAALAKVHQLLQPSLNEMFFTRKLVLVEGLEDVAYIHSWLTIKNLWSKFRVSGCHIVPTGGKSEIIRPGIIAKELEIPAFCLFDADGDKIDKQDKKEKHEKDNMALLRIFGGNDKEPFPKDIVWGKNIIVFPEDLRNSVEADFNSSLGKENYEKIKNGIYQEFGFAPDLGKDGLFIGSLLTAVDIAKGQSKTLDTICRALTSFE